MLAKPIIIQNNGGMNARGMASASGTARLNGFRMRQIGQQNSGRCPMTDAGWAERKVVTATTGYTWNARIRKSTVILPSIAAKLLLAEHKRAVRVVKREIERVKKDQHTYHSEERCLILGSLETVLKALQKGRT